MTTAAETLTVLVLPLRFQFASSSNLRFFMLEEKEEGKDPRYCVQMLGSIELATIVLKGGTALKTDRQEGEHPTARRSSPQGGNSGGLE